MVHRLSRATSYLQTFAIDLAGNQILRSFATGFFIRAGKSILLITNWHVVSGLDPSDTTKTSKPPPVLMKATVISKQRTVTELTLPLYNKELKPVWFEHQLGSEVDLAIYELPQILGNYFDFIDVHSAEDPFQIDEKVASDVFILGYPFSRDEFKEAFGVNSPYYLPVWKRGSIAFEPSLRLTGRILLIDALSRAGMSGSPVFLVRDVDVIGAGSAVNEEPLARLAVGDSQALHEIDPSKLTSGRKREFRFLGVYSGTFGTTKLAETALGKCWHIDTLREAIENSRHGHMPAHAPFENEHYANLLRSIEGKLIRKDGDGNIQEEFSLDKVGGSQA